MNTKNLLGILAVVVVVLAGRAYAMSGKSSDKQPAVAQVETTPAAPTPTTPPTETVVTPTAPTTALYKDGRYAASGEYRAPSGPESVNVTLTLKNDIVVDSIVVGTGKNPQTKEKQADFIANYKTYVIGKNISEINLSVVSGSSLTSTGFNAAVAKIKTEAKA